MSVLAAHGRDLSSIFLEAQSYNNRLNIKEIVPIFLDTVEDLGSDEFVWEQHFKLEFLHFSKRHHYFQLGSTLGPAKTTSIETEKNGTRRHVFLRETNLYELADELVEDTPGNAGYANFT